MMQEKRVALVTGGASGIGKEIVKEMLENGYDVCTFDINEEGLHSVQHEFAQLGRLSICAGDVGDEQDVARCVKDTIKSFGRIDVLVNNAGGSFHINGSVETIAPDDWDKVVRLNLRNQFLFIHEVVPFMKERRYGRIVCMSSKAGRSRGSGNSGSPYTAAKAGILGLVRQASADLGPFGITVNAVAPGVIMSGERIRSYWAKRSPEDVAAQMKNIPVGRFGVSEDVAYAVLFLCGEKASFINGAVLDVNGGAWVG